MTALRDVLPATADVSVTLNLHQVQPASDRDEDRGGGRARRPDRQPDVPRPDVRRRLLRRPARHDRGPDRLVVRAAPATRPRSGSRSTRSGSTTTTRRGSRRTTAPAASVPRHPPGALRRHPRPADGDGVADRRLRVSPTCCSGCSATCGLPIQVTENGMAAHDVLVEAARSTTTTASTTCATTSRPCTTRRHGADVRGLLRVDAAGQLRVGVGLRQAVRHRARRPRDQQRTPKDSALWYAEVIAKHGL